MTLDEAMEKLQEMVGGYLFSISGRETPLEWLAKARSLFTEVQSDAFRRGWHKALDFVEQEVIQIKSYWEVKNESPNTRS